MITRKFTEAEVAEMVYDGYIIEGDDDRRWSRTNTSIVNVDGKFYELYYEHGLTECQEDSYDAQEAPEVEKKEVTRTITTTEWVAIK